MTQRDTRPARARSLLLADHKERCDHCRDGASCADGDELRRVLMREAGDRLSPVSAMAAALATFNRALRVQLAARGFTNKENAPPTARKARRAPSR